MYKSKGLLNEDLNENLNEALNEDLNEEDSNLLTNNESIKKNCTENEKDSETKIIIDEDSTDNQFKLEL